MPGIVDHCWTTPSICTNGNFDTHPHLAKAFIFTNKWLMAQGLYWNKGVIHLSCLSSSQHYLQRLHKVSNSLAKSVCEVSDTVCLHSLTNKLHLWYWLPLKHISCDNILQFVTDIVQRMGVFGKLLRYAMPISSSIPSPVPHPLHAFWAIVLITITLFLFRLYVFKFSRYIGIGD